MRYCIYPESVKEVSKFEAVNNMDRSILKNPKLPDVAAVFQAAQVDKPLHAHLLSKLIQTFNQVNQKSFTNKFIACLKKIFINKQDTQMCCASIALEFAVKFVITLLDEDARKNETPSENVIRFSTNIFGFLKEKHNVQDMRIRKRVCQFVARFMMLMAPDAELDCKICEIIIDIMKERIKDRVPAVRIQAILAVYRLQDNANVNCPVTKMLLNSVETDTAADVRKLALVKISLKHRFTVKTIIDRVDDASDKVRKDIYVVLSKLHPLYLNGAERKRILYTGLYSNNESVRNVVRNQLLPAWFKRMDSDYMKFLRMFDLIFDSPVLMIKILMSLIETTEEEKNRETIDAYLNQAYAIPFEHLTCESAFYWRCYVFFVSDLVDEKRDYEWQAGKSYDAHAVSLLPDLSVFCDYIKTFYLSMSRGDEGDEKWIRKEQEFIFAQLIELCKIYDYADEVGRKNLQLLCLNLLQEVEIKTLKPVIQLYFNLRTNLNESICKVTSEVNNLLHPNGAEISVPVSVQEKDTHKTPNPDVTPELEKSLRFKMAKLEVRLEELNDLQEGAIKAQDFTKAEFLKNDITSVREQINLLKDSFYCKPMSVCYDSMEEAENFSEELEKVVNPLERLEVNTVLRCLTILREMLNLSLIKYLTPELRALLQDFVLFACKDDNHLIAPLATELLGSFCLRDKNLAKEYFITIFSLCGNNFICVSALKVIFDFLACFDAETFNITNLDDDEKVAPRRSTSSVSNVSSDDEEEDDDMISGYAFVSTLINLLDDEYIEARYTVVHGLCRLMAVGKLKSAKVLSRLIVMWFHPSSREAVEIRSCLNFFFPFFVRFGWSLRILEEAFLPTVEILFEAPSHNPISEINPKDVIKVLCDLTNPTYVSQVNKNSENIHLNLAVLICKAVMEMDLLDQAAILLKALDFLNLSGIHSSTLSTINNLLDKMTRKFKKKRCNKLLNDVHKFKTKLNATIENHMDTSPEL